MRKFTGISFWRIIFLALLAVPRVVLHDLGWLTEGTFINSLFVFVPVLIWVAMAVWCEDAHPFRMLLAAGIVFGIMLALVHQIFWTVYFPDVLKLGGNLAGAPDYISIIVTRTAAVVSSLVTGTMMGVLLGGVAFIIRKLIR
ncbi:hypothetical protein [Salinicoccus sediminis]|nr:hypothetical protein [Salinicoccus sediminis]